ncbi:nuclear pore assembly and biogenesis-domain-containing protein [Massariosphaeria phaeospora]|uniref:Nuclear pore assembly and biogenesis-domain-containing protein n=1 Tax=Massariosphaeria phaeospora TaxID=100035 RepID=A0A7C8MLJ0_9PLEO|nr:nuclear pore assembly and biogenesis-domain-containing protein [Massariosphaeria phaeospora]
MDFIQDYIHLLPRFLPPTLLSPLLTFLTTSFGVFKALQTHLSPLLARLATQPDVASILVLVTVLFVSFKILGMAYRAVMFWVKLAVRLALWGGIALVGLWVWSRGVEGFVDDVQGLAAFWMGEYERFGGEVKAWQREKEGQIRMETGAKGRGRGSRRGVR